MKEKFHDIPIHHKHRQMLPVWFFIGILLFIYGVIILYVGVNEYPPHAGRAGELPCPCLRRHCADLAGRFLHLEILAPNASKVASRAFAAARGAE